jgi:hypothetical protein
MQSNFDLFDTETPSYDHTSRNTSSPVNAGVFFVKHLGKLTDVTLKNRKLNAELDFESCSEGELEKNKKKSDSQNEQSEEETTFFDAVGEEEEMSAKNEPE